MSSQREVVRLVGGTASPYTQKMVALLRYRRVPYAVTRGQPDQVCDALAVAYTHLRAHETVLDLV